MNGRMEGRNFMERKARKPKDSEVGLKMYYQPIIQPMFGKTVGYEALIRLIDKELSFVSPSLFIPIAEKAGLNTALENWIFEETCGTLQKMVKKGIEFEYISINVFVKHLKKKTYISELLSIAEETGAPTDRLCLEISEDSFKTNKEAIVERMFELKKAGFKLAIDDYSANYVPLSKLDTIPTDIIKLDKNIADRIVIDKKVEEDTAGIIKQAQILGIDVIAKAVEEQKQQLLLMGLGCQKMQGFLFGEPMKDRDVLNPKTK